jgi:hypothetical protein
VFTVVSFSSLYQMNAQRYISLDAVLSLPSIRSITDSRDVLVAAIASSQQLALDEARLMVRPTNLKVERVTLIVRDLPADYTIATIKGLFPTTPVASASLELGNNWFVTFASEDACMAAALYLRSQTLDGKPFQFRVKSENLLNTYNPATEKQQQKQQQLIAGTGGDASAAPAPTTGAGFPSGPNAPFFPQFYKPYGMPPYGAPHYVDPNSAFQQSGGRSAGRGGDAASGGPASATPPSPSKGKGVNARARRGACEKRGDVVRVVCVCICVFVVGARDGWIDQKCNVTFDECLCQQVSQRLML